jgi:murein DD-endopeptidase MepM/ murein hydrolase activator NlpD
VFDLGLRALLVIAVLAAIVGAGMLSIKRFEGEPPVLESPERIILGKTPVPLVVRLVDADSGLRSISVRLLHGTGSQSLFEETYPGSLAGGGLPGGNERTVEIQLDVEALHVPDGAATIVVDARDWSLRDGFAGNRTESSIALEVDTRAPTVSLQSGLTYVYRGGTAAAVYRLGEDVAWDGVRVGDTRYRGFPHPGGGERLRVAIFSIPVDGPRHPDVAAIAIDAAGNEGRVSFPAKVREKRFIEADINIDQAFLERVAVPLAKSAGLEFDSPLRAFQLVNSELRARSEQLIRERLAESQPEPLWRGAFVQMRGSKVMSRFAEHRTYRLRDEKISEARHYGFDLASTSRAPVPAAGAGIVKAAEDLGIYGKCVLIDHGFGVSTLYGHLSQLDVAQGERVSKDQQLGLTGVTGLAGGDHLHFAVLVGGSYVDPMEWWDPKWMRSHIDVRLEQSIP